MTRFSAYFVPAEAVSQEELKGQLAARGLGLGINER